MVRDSTLRSGVVQHCTKERVLAASSTLGPDAACSLEVPDPVGDGSSVTT
eukprot:CAMPEP_0115256046 /NCGR_PEP_ID=MMETSP0270-20121206/46039_1 /TAXON_ID=71861 /ORGANISM="Scrippsiella trochoidea, Strain CCMP3099" /LENGTH=49 /DNA_ID= /DNA_START= /DNA_END= /DNA_ORIENTATION=